jgi:translation elongation factor EF-Tu-like GTPase
MVLMVSGAPPFQTLRLIYLSPEKLVMPGDNVEMVGELVHDIALEAGSRFTLREGGKTIGTGIISEVYEK